MIQAAIVGLGRWGRLLVEAAEGGRSGLRFVTGVDTDPARTNEFAARHQLKLTGSYDEVLADPAIQAVVLATPHCPVAESFGTGQNGTDVFRAMTPRFEGGYYFPPEKPGFGTELTEELVKKHAA